MTLFLLALSLLSKWHVNIVEYVLPKESTKIAPYASEIEASTLNRALPDDSGNIFFYDQELGLSVKYPSNWTIEPRPSLPDLKGSTKFFLQDFGTGKVIDQLAPQTSPSIAISERDVHLPMGMSLLRFTELDQCSTNLYAGKRSADVLPWTGTIPQGTADLIYVRGENFQYVHLLRGKIVWIVSANFGASDPTELSEYFEDFVSSFAFRDDAPSSLEEIYRRKISYDSNPFPGVDSDNCQPFDQ